MADLTNADILAAIRQAGAGLHLSIWMVAAITNEKPMLWIGAAAWMVVSVGSMVAAGGGQ